MAAKIRQVTNEFAANLFRDEKAARPGYRFQALWEK